MEILYTRYVSKKKQQKTQDDTFKKLLLLAATLALIFTVVLLKWKDSQNTQYNADFYLRLVEIRLTYLELYNLDPASIDFSDRFVENTTKLQEQYTQTQAYFEKHRSKLPDYATKSLDAINRQLTVIGKVGDTFSQFDVLFSPMYRTVPSEQLTLLPRETIQENVLTLSQDIHSVSSYINESPDYGAMRDSTSKIIVLIEEITLELDNDSNELPTDLLFNLLEAVTNLRTEAHTHIKQGFETDEAIQTLTDLTNLIQELRTEITTTVE